MYTIFACARFRFSTQTLTPTKRDHYPQAVVNYAGHPRKALSTFTSRPRSRAFRYAENKQGRRETDQDGNHIPTVGMVKDKNSSEWREPSLVFTSVKHPTIQGTYEAYAAKTPTWIPGIK